MPRLRRRPLALTPPASPAPPVGLVRPAPGRGRILRIALVAVPLGVLANLGISFLATDRSVLASLGGLPRGYLLLALGLALVPWLTGTLRLLIWTRFLGHPLPPREALRMTLAVDLGSSVSPTAVGGGFLKWGMLLRRGVHPGTAAALVALPTVEDGLFFAVAVPAALLLAASMELAAWGTVAELVGGSLGAALVAPLALGGVGISAWAAGRACLAGRLGPRIRRASIRLRARGTRRLRSAWREARAAFALVAVRGKSRLALSLLLTAVHWGARYSVVTALVAFLGIPVKPLLFWSLQWLVFTFGALVPTPGAAGGAEVAFSLVYGAFLPAGVLGLATAGWRFLTFYLQLGLAALLFPLLGLAGPRDRAGG